MAAQPIYIETEEEIPEVIERVRRTPSEDIPLVLPTRSRFGQSRFNFQLLRQYAQGLGKRVSIISPDPAVQQMAEENGFRTFRAVEQLGDEVAPLAVAGAPAAAARVAGVDLPPARTAAPAAGGAPRLVVKPPQRIPSRVATEARPGRLLLYTGAALILVAGLVAGALYVPAATVTITANAAPFSQNLQVDGVAGSGPVKIRTVTVTHQASGSFKATGVKTTPAAVANGAVQFNNTCGGGPIGPSFKIPTGQRVTGGGQTFATTAEITKLDPGQSASANIVAVTPGAAGNVPDHTINAIQGNPLDCLKVVQPAATSGGADEKKEPQIQTSDIENARSALDAQIRKDIGDDLAKQSAAGEKLADTAIQYQPPDFGTDQPVGTVTGGFNATMKIAAEGAFYSPDDVQKAFTDLLAKKVPAGQELTDNKVKANYDIVNASTGGHLSFKGTATSYVAPHIDRERLKSQLAARSVGGAKAQLGKLPIQSATIKQSPFQVPFMPLTASRITIVYEIDQVASPAPSPSPHS